MTVRPSLHGSAPPLSGSDAVFATDPLTQLIAASIADEVLTDLAWVLSASRPESELSRLSARSAERSLAATVSPVLAAVLAAAQRAETMSGGWFRPIRSPQAAAGIPELRFDPETRHLVLPRGTELDLWAVGCAWAAEHILERIEQTDPFATVAVVVGPAVVTVGAAWEISEALQGELTVLDPALQRGRRRFGVLQTDEAEPTSAPPRRRPCWDRIAVAADDAVRAVALAGATQRLGPVAPDWIQAVGGEAELRSARSVPFRGQRRVRTEQWAARGL